MYKLIRNAHVLTLDDDGREWEHADILINGSIIEDIGVNVEIPTDIAEIETIEARGMLAMPGLINSHFHSPSAFMKGAIEGMHLEPYMLFEAPRSDRWESKRIYYLRSMLTAMDMLKVGVTTVRDDAHFFSHPSIDMIDGVFEAFRDSGMRASVALGMANVPELEKLPYLADLITESAAAVLGQDPCKEKQELLALYKDVTKRWHGENGGRLTVHGSVSAPQRVTPDYLQALSEYCVDNNMALDMHVLETKTQRVHGDLVHGKSFVQYIDELGVLNDNAVLIHCVWVDDRDMDSIARAGAVVAHNPISNLRIGSGVMPYKAIADRGITVSLGTDEPSVDEPSNLWNNAKIGALLQKITEPDYHNWPAASSYVSAMCAGGARAMRQQNSIGSLANGMQADVILLDLNSLAFTPRNDLFRHLVFSENGSSVKLTMVAGDIVYKDGKLQTVDEESIKAEIAEFWAEYRRDCDAGNARNAELAKIFSEVCSRSAAIDVGFSRWLNLH